MGNRRAKPPDVGLWLWQNHRTVVRGFCIGCHDSKEFLERLNRRESTGKILRQNDASRRENVTNMCDCVSFAAVSGEYGPHEVLSYQLTHIGSGQPRSETSDEWVDVEITDSEGEEGEDAIAG